MKMNDTLEQAFNDQITLELSASSVYRQLAVALDLLDLNGMAAWMRKQSQEEIEHAERFIAHLDARDNEAQIGTIEKPEVKITSAVEAFEAAYEHEQKVSAAIRALRKLADEEGDVDSRPLLDDFLTEQISEEDTVRTIVGRLRIAGNDGGGLLRIDDELAQR